MGFSQDFAVSNNTHAHTATHKSSLYINGSSALKRTAKKRIEEVKTRLTVDYNLRRSTFTSGIVALMATLVAVHTKMKPIINIKNSLKYLSAY